MNDWNQDKQLLDDLHKLAEIQPSAEATAQAIARARAAVIAQGARPLVAKWRMAPVAKWAASAAALLAVALVAQWLAQGKAGGNFAFAEVVGQLDKAKTVQYVRTRTNFLQNRRLEGETRKVMILGRYQMREEVTETPGDAPPAGVAAVEKAGDHYIMIQNAQTGKMIDLSPADKTYTIPQVIFGIDQNTEEVKQQAIAPDPAVDFYKKARAFPAAKAKKLPSRVIDGRQATGFQVVESVRRKNGTDTSTRTYWIDCKTRLPLRIETSLRSTNPMMASSDFVQEHFVFDAPLDAALFSTDPPAGYRDSAETEAADAEPAKVE